MTDPTRPPDESQGIVAAEVSRYARVAGRGLGKVVIAAIPVAIGVVLATFFLLRIVPGDPARAILGDQASDAAVAALHDRMGLDRPLMVQLGDYIGDLARGELGTSLMYGVPTTSLIAQRAAPTLALVVMAALAAVLIAVPLALIAGRYHDRWPDHLIRLVPTIGAGLPVFWFGLILISIFATRLGWFPVGGTGSGADGLGGFISMLGALVLPAMAASASIVPLLVRSLRTQSIDVLDSDATAMQIAAGLSRGRIMRTHVLRNAALPMVTILGLNVAYLIGGTIVVENVFDINGIGALLFEAVGSRDYPVVQGIALVSALAVVVVSILTEAVLVVLDPRLRIRTRP